MDLLQLQLHQELTIFAVCSIVQSIEHFPATFFWRFPHYDFPPLPPQVFLSSQSSFLTLMQQSFFEAWMFGRLIWQLKFWANNASWVSFSFLKQWEDSVTMLASTQETKPWKFNCLFISSSNKLVLLWEYASFHFSFSPPPLQTNIYT